MIAALFALSAGVCHNGSILVMVNIHKVKTKITIQNGVVAAIFSVGIAAFLYVMFHAATVQAAPAPANTICRPASQTFTHTTTAFVGDSGLQARQASALSWLKSMMEPVRNQGDGSTISPDAWYANGYSGAMSGSFSLANSRATTGAAPETYENLELRYYLVTDDEYLQSSQAARADNQWAFTANNNSGTKLFRLVDTNTSEILAEYYEPETNGLIRSYEYLPGQDGYGTSRVHNSYMYDQALALMVAIGAGDRPLADELLSGLAAVQVSSGPAAGAFPASTDQLNSTDTDDSYYTGGNAVVLYALTRYVEAYGNSNNAVTMLQNGLRYIATVKTASGPAAGLYEGGRILNGGSLDDVSWHSTEHNLDLWHVFERAGRVLNDAMLTAEADALSERIVALLWNTSENRFNQGYNDTERALDTTSWGSIFLAAIGEYDKAVQSVANAEAYVYDGTRATGYTPYLRPDSIPTVWYEGTFGVALAHHVLGNQTAHTGVVNNAIYGQQANGAFPYADDADLANGRTDANSVASTAWFLLGTAYPSAIWNECRADAAAAVDEGEAPLVPGAPNTGVKGAGATVGGVTATYGVGLAAMLGLAVFIGATTLLVRRMRLVRQKVWRAKK